MKIPIEQILPSPEPVRTQMEPAKLDELAASIKEQGLIVPIKVRPVGDMNEIVYGHRRFAASKMAGLKELECYVEGIDDTNALIQAGIENIHREDMNPIDKARWLAGIRDAKNCKSDAVGEIVGLSGRHVRRLLALLEESPSTQDKLRTARPKLTTDHIDKVRGAGVDEVEKKKLIDKVERDGLTAEQIGAVAQSVAAAQDPRTKARLIEQKYDPYTHDPIEVEKRAKRFGKADPIEDDTKSPAINWASLPEVSRVLKALSTAEHVGESIIEMVQEGKFAPEAIPFTVKKIKKMIAVWENVIEEMEG